MPGASLDRHRFDQLNVEEEVLGSFLDRQNESSKNRIFTDSVHTNCSKQTGTVLSHFLDYEALLSHFLLEVLLDLVNLFGRKVQHIRSVVFVARIVA